MSKIKKIPPGKIKFLKGTYSVVQFLNFSGKLFDCIPDTWFVNEEKNLCFWPPKSGKSFTLRAMNQEIPEEEDWEVYECVIVSEGHATYSIGSAVVREKCSQHCNTSSAEEHLEAAQFRRKHPGLISKGEETFENLFSLKDNREIDKHNLKDQDKSQATSNGGATHSNLGSQSHTNHPQSHSIRSKSKEHEKSQVASIHSYSKYPDNRSKSNSRIHFRTGSRTHSRSGSRTKSRSGSRTHSRSGSSYLSHSRRTNSHSGSGNRSQSGTRCHSRSDRATNCLSGSKHHSSLRRCNIDSRSSSSEAGYSNHISLSSSNRSRSRSDFHSKTSRSSHLTNRSYNAQRSGSRPVKRRYNHEERNPDRARQCQQTNKSIRSRKVPSSAARGRNFYARQPSTSTVRSHINSDLISNIDLRQRSVSTNLHERNFNDCEPSTLIGRSRLNSNLQTNSNRSHSRELSSHSTHTRSQVKSSCHQKMAMGHSRRNDPSNSPYRQIQHQATHSADESYRGIQVLIREVKGLTNIVNKNNRLFVENHRRLTRMEVTENKTLIMLGDLTQAINTRMSLVNSITRGNTPPRGFHMPLLPITRLKELAIIHRDLKNKKFRSFLINEQKHYCTPSKSTDNVVMTAYLKRFISVSVRALIVLKDLKGQSGETLYHNYYRVYLFLIDVMKAGYLMHNKMLTNNDVHSILRVVWGRSKQLLNEENNKRQSH